MMWRPFLILVLLSACGGTAPAARELDQGSEAIINGDVCAEGDSPEVVAILPKMTLRANGQTVTVNTIACTGTLIAPDVVLAAGHCVDSTVYAYDLSQQGVTLQSIEFYISYKTDLISLSEGRTNTMPDDAVKVRAFDIHPDYSLQNTGNGPQKSNDISVLYLDSAQSVTPAVVIAHDEVSQLVEQAPVEIVGWGQQTSASTPPAGTVGEKECATSFVNQLGDWEMQIGGDSSTARKCHGDSGGPTFLTIETSYVTKRRVVGVTSHAYDSTDCQKGGVDTRVDPYVDWLDETLTKRCTAGERVWCDVPGVIPPSYYEPPATNTGGPGVAGSGGDADSVRNSRCSSGAISWLALCGLVMLARRRRVRA